MLIKKKMTSVLNLLAIGTVIVGCAKEVPYESLYKEPEVLSIKDSFLVEENGKKVEYLYIPTTSKIPKFASGRAFYDGNHKIVFFKFAEDGLEVWEKEKENSGSSNDMNDSLVMTIPGTYIDYRCREDKYGECTNTEETVSDVEWHQKKFFKPDFSGVRIKEVNTISLWGSVASDSCVSKGEAGLTFSEISKGVLNFEIENAYTVAQTGDCFERMGIERVEQFSELSFKAREFYSFIRLSNVVSKNYEKFNYIKDNHSKFGFFKGYESKIGEFHDFGRPVEKYYMNRWNNKTADGGPRVLRFHLSDSFNNTKMSINKVLKERTFQVAERINDALIKSNSNLRLEIVEPSGKRPGDIRNNMVVLIEDPIQTGLLGYAPSVTNPRTGEIVKSHINMYGGVLKSFSSWVWSEMVDLSRELKNKKLAKVGHEGMASDASEHSHVKSIIASGNHSLSTSNKDFSFKVTAQSHDHNFDGKEEVLKRLAERNMKRDPKETPLYLKKLGKENARLQKKLKEHNDFLKDLAKNNAYHKDLVNIAGIAKNIYPGIDKIKGVMTRDGVLKEWDTLTIKQKRAAEKIIVPLFYTSTLIHEFGHALGLRHNFAGSFDKDNYYSKEEADELGLEVHAPYSSIMDYGFTSLNDLLSFGKYDIAALRYGYAQEVEMKNGEIVKVGEKAIDSIAQKGKRFVEAANSLRMQLVTDFSKKIIAEEQRNVTVDEIKEMLASNQEYQLAQAEADANSLREFDFCTDENEGLSLSCQAGDEGSSLKEVVQHKIDRYNRYYHYRNFRRGKKRFSQYDDETYLIARYREFQNIRSVMEQYTFFEDIFSSKQMVTGCSDLAAFLYPICERINDIIGATDIAGRFFLNVAKTPEKSCLVINKTPDTPLSIVGVFPLAPMSETINNRVGYYPQTCFDNNIIEYLGDKNTGDLPIAEVGKFLNNIKDNSDSLIQYSSDISIRGVGVDRIMAILALTQRYGQRENYYRGFANHPKFSDEIDNILAHMTLGTPLKKAVPFKTVTNEEVPYPYEIRNEEVNGVDEVFSWARSFLGLNSEGLTKLGKPFLKIAKKYSYTANNEFRKSAMALSNKYSIFKNDAHSIALDSEKFTLLKTGDDGVSYYAHRKLTPMAFSLVNVQEKVTKLSTFKKDLIKRVINRRQNLRKNPIAPSSFDKLQKSAFKLMKKDLLDAILYAVRSKIPLDPTRILSIVGGNQELADLTMAVYTKGEAYIVTILDAKKNVDKIPPAGASAAENILYKDFALETLIDFDSGQMKARLQVGLDSLEIMPAYKAY